MSYLLLIVPLLATFTAAAEWQSNTNLVKFPNPSFIPRGIHSHLNTRVASINSSSYPQTNFTFGDSKIVWGCDIDPVATLGNLTTICPTSGNCIDNEPYTQSIKYTKPNPGGYAEAPTSDSLTIEAHGFYPESMRDTLVQAVQAAVSAPGVIQWDRRQGWGLVPGKARRANMPIPPTPSGLCDLATFSSYIGITYWATATSPEAHIDINISVPDPDDGFCGNLGQGVLGIGGAVAGAIDVLAPLAYVLGIIDAACALAEGS